MGIFLSNKIMSYSIRQATLNDRENLTKLFFSIKAKEEDYIQAVVEASLRFGFCLVASIDDKFIACVCAVKLGAISSVSHTLTDLTLVVNQDYQKKGIGKEILLKFLEEIEKSSEFGRVEVMVNEKFENSISFYESIGFKRQGKFEKRIKTKDGYQDDIALAWLNPYYKW